MSQPQEINMASQSGNLVVTQSDFRGHPPSQQRADSQKETLSFKSGQPLPDLTCPRRRVKWNAHHPPSIKKQMMGRWHGPLSRRETGQQPGRD